MRLVERYLNEVKERLPANKRDDIIEELRGSIEEQIGDRVSLSDSALAHASAADNHIGEPANDFEVNPTGLDASLEDQKAVLLTFGHPAKVANSFRAHQYLIGPNLFPAFLQTLRVLLTLGVALHFALLLILALTSNTGLSLLGVFFHLAKTTIWLVGLTVAIFTALEYSNQSFTAYRSWHPDLLQQPSVSLVSRGDVLTNFITEGVFLLWWNGAVKFQNWLPFLGEDAWISLSDAWQPLFWPLNLIIGTAFVLHAYVLFRGLWHRKTLVIELSINMLVLFACSYLLRSKTLLETSGLGEWADSTSPQASVKGVLLVIAIITVWESWLAVNRYRQLS